MDAIYRFDIGIFEALAPFHGGLLDSILIFITHLADHGILWMALTVLLLCFKRTRPTGVCLFFSLLIFLLFNNFVLKNIFARPRPYIKFDYVALVPWPSGDSFPSGHSAMCMACAYALARTLGHPAPEGSALKPAAARWLGVLAYIFSLAVCFSRIWVQVHYCTDVLGGIVTGTLSGICGVLLSWFLLRRYGAKIGVAGVAQSPKQ